jgi:cellulose synthase operon protein C
VTALRDCTYLERTHAFADGELVGAAADAARDHLATCDACQAELAEVLQLDAAVADRRTVGVISLAWYRRRPLQIAGVALAVAASVTIYLSLPRDGGPGAPQVAVALAPRRAVEARLAWSGAADYRIYDVPRAGDSPHEVIAMRTLADLEARGDLHGVGALALLNGERRRAAEYLARAGDSAGVLSDRAALALADHQPEVALAHADAALAKDPGHGPALWNRALALRELGLARASAAAFREVARRGEPGWAGEARQRAASLDADTAAVEQRFQRLQRAAAALARGPIELAADDARAMPGLARALLYDAIRSADTPAQLAALQPLAEAVDAADRDTAMQSALTRAGAALRPALSRRYGEVARAFAAGDAAQVPVAAGRQLVADLRTARADDLRIGALIKLSEVRTLDADDLQDLSHLTAASPDPWMQLLGLQHQAQLALAAGDLPGAEAVLTRAKQRCTAPDAPPRRCAVIGLRLGDFYVASQRLPDARAALSAAWKLARAAGEWGVQHQLLAAQAALAARGDDTGTAPSLLRAFNDEKAQRTPVDAHSIRHPQLPSSGE